SAVHLRSEPRYAFQFSPSIADQEERIFEAIQIAPRPFILYVTRPDEADKWLGRLKGAGYHRVSTFTGRTPSGEREQLLCKWSANELDGMIATSAFGLGVDKNDVRTILHATLPESLDRFYQEVGRGGRDGRASASLLVYTNPDVDQARGMASEKVLRDETAFDRWSLMISHADRSKDQDLYWVDLNSLPSHLTVTSERNLLWNVRTLTLMARAGLIELVALGHGENLDDEAVQDLSSVSRAAVRITGIEHLDREAYSKKLAGARESMVQMGRQGIETMLGVARQEKEISQALTATYSVMHDVWSPVVSCCGGCATHWKNRASTSLYSPPRAGRLQRFSKRDIGRISKLGLPMASPRLLVIAVPESDDFVSTCQRMALNLAYVVRPHSWLMESSFTSRFLRSLEDVLRKLPNDDSFIDVVNAHEADAWVAGGDEVRVIFMDRDHPATFPREIWSSDAALEIVIVRRSLGDPDHNGRRFIDTVAHVASSTFLGKITT
ncbi:MAG: hypothetical protein KDB22_29845, partial [Planctomycetales bacterium]|nr:hypothetical protein [Planctomycetales bacterium]